MKFLLAPIAMCVCLQCGAQAAAPAPGAAAAPVATSASPVPSPTDVPALAPLTATPEPLFVSEPEVKHTVIEGEATRIDELRVRGVAQRITVTTKAPHGTTYEIIMGDGSRDLSDGANTSRGAAGKRVWRVLDF